MSLEPNVARSAANAQFPRGFIKDYLTTINNREIICVRKIPQLPKSPVYDKQKVEAESFTVVSRHR